MKTAAELQAALAGNPFPRQSKDDPSHLLLHFFEGKPPASAAKTLAAWDRGPEQAKLGKGVVYLYYPAGMGRSKLTNAVLERTVASPGTARNFTTVTRLLALCAALPGAGK